MLPEQASMLPEQVSYQACNLGVKITVQDGNLQLARDFLTLADDYLKAGSTTPEVQDRYHALRTRLIGGFGSRRLCDGGTYHVARWHVIGDGITQGGWCCDRHLVETVEKVMQASTEDQVRIYPA